MEIFVHTKNYFFIILFFFLLLNIHCSKRPKKDIKPSTLFNNNLNKDYSKLDLCGCNDEGNNILDMSISIMRPLKSVEKLRKNVLKKEEMKSLLSNWGKLMTSCFSKHGANMWTPSDCNDLELITEKKDTLYNLGIQIDHGGLLKL